MPGDKDIHNDPNANTNGFKENPQNIGKGRPKKIYSVIKEMGYSADDIKTAFGELAFYSQKELEDAKNDESKPVITRIIANQFLTAFKDANWNKIKEILEHVVGKPKEEVKQIIVNDEPKIDLSIDGVKIDLKI